MSTDGRVREAATLSEVLVARRNHQELAYAFLADGERATRTLSWSELADRVSAASAAIRHVAAPGDRVLLFFRPGLDFLVAFLGCLQAGVVAVPCVPPSRPVRRSAERIQAVARVAEPAVVVASPDAVVVPRDELLALAPALRLAVWLGSADLEGNRAGTAPFARPEHVALLQFTSGSTGSPRGVMITHANLMHNLGLIHDCFEHDRRSVSVTWLPVFHDMGLIDGMLEPLFAGIPCYAMPPHAFAQRPLRWLRAISRYRATHSGGPNFAYDLCAARSVEASAAALDLSSWRVAYNGAEPIRASTMEAFARAYAPSGFRSSAFHPCYGLAEATLKVSGAGADDLRPRRLDAEPLERGEVREAPPGARGQCVASCGPPHPGVRVAIVSSTTGSELGPEQIGEIWVAGPSVSPGYFADPAATAVTFGARLPTGEGPFLRTGDLGFTCGGELYVTGRLKDVIIVQGRNLYPQDLEHSVELAHDELTPGGSAAFSFDDGTAERLVVLVEVPRGGHTSTPPTKLLDAARRAIARDHQVEPTVLLAVPRGSLPKTTSGKIRRGTCRNDYRGDRLDIVATLRAEEASS
jgi:acyl-CoA synthetase (AMP-forming)/AMP-acid ligase II